MKKNLCLLIIPVICISLVACGGKAPQKDSSTDEKNVAADQGQATEENDEIEIKIDYVAEKLGLTDESEVMFDLIGAVAGKQYRGGNVELYRFDENSDAYKDIIGGKTYLNAAAYKDGIVLVFALGVEEDKTLIDSFNALEF